MCIHLEKNNFLHPYWQMDSEFFKPISFFNLSNKIQFLDCKRLTDDRVYMPMWLIQFIKHKHMTRNFACGQCSLLAPVLGVSLPVLESRPMLLLLLELSPLMRTEMPLKLLALVMAGLKFRLELSESVLLHGRGSEYFGSFSELLWRLLAERPSFNLNNQLAPQ